MAAGILASFWWQVPTKYTDQHLTLLYIFSLETYRKFLRENTSASARHLLLLCSGAFRRILRPNTCFCWTWRLLLQRYLLQVTKSCIDLDRSILYIWIKRLFSIFAQENKTMEKSIWANSSLSKCFRTGSDLFFVKTSFWKPKFFSFSGCFFLFDQILSFFSLRENPDLVMC